MSMLVGRAAWDFWCRWVVATVVGWILGLVLAIALSFLVVNPFYAKETDLIVGVCLGATVSFSQRFSVRQWLRLAPIFVWGAAIGIGIPFVVEVISSELGSGLGAVASTAVLAVGALICGLLQMPALRRYVGMSYVWPLVTLVAWSAAWMISRWPSIYGTLAATVLHGIVSGGVLVWLLNQKRSSEFGDAL